MGLVDTLEENKLKNNNITRTRFLIFYDNDHDPESNVRDHSWDNKSNYMFKTKHTLSDFTRMELINRNIMPSRLSKKQDILHQQKCEYIKKILDDILLAYEYRHMYDVNVLGIVCEYICYEPLSWTESVKLKLKNLISFK